MLITERKLRVWGYLALSVIFFLFFMLEMFFWWHDEHMILKVLLITVFQTVLIWEPTRFFILKLRKRYSGLKNVQRRLLYAVVILTPYAFLVGFLRIYLEEVTYLWNVSVATITNYSFTIGITLLFILLELAAYEGLYFFDQWSKSLAETEELKRLNVQIQMDSLKVQIQPHFLFNTLNTLIGLIEEDSGRAIRFTEDLAFVYRYLLQANDRVLISLEEELQFTTIYFSLLKTRYPDGLFLVEEVRSIEGFEVPPLSLHILIENAVKHNSFSTAKPLTIEIRHIDERDQIMVVNNVQPKNNQPKSGKGLAYLRKQFSILNLPPIEIQQIPNQFSVIIPLINKYHYERSNH